MVAISEIKKACIIPYQKDYSKCNQLLSEYNIQSITLLRKKEALRNKYNLSPTKDLGIEESLTTEDRISLAMDLKKVQALKAQIVDMYKRMIEKKAEAAALRFGISAKDYAQKLYMALLENLDSYAKLKEPARELTRFLRFKNPGYNDFMSRADLPVDELSPEEEAENFSYNIDKQFEEDDIYRVIMDMAKNILNEKEFNVLSEWFNGKKLDEIAYPLGLTRERVRQIKEKAIKELRKSQVRRLYYDDNRTLPVIPADKQLFRSVKKEKEIADIDVNALLKYGVDVDKVRELTKYDYNKPNIWGQLDILIRTQSRYGFGRILYDKKARELFEAYLEDSPNYKIRLKLPNDTKKEIFIPQAEKISMDIFGKNIFEFY